MASISRALLDKLLDGIEQRELRSLQWGFVDGSIGEDEMYALVREILAPLGDSTSPDDLVEALLACRLIVERRQEDGTYRYRSRFAEGVRLLVTLRQLFPNQPWVSAPGLVSDYRLDARPRRFPRRDIAAPEALQTLAQEAHWSPLHKELAAALLPDEFHLAAFQVRAMRQIVSKNDSERGVVISAGTGTGKTLAFYLPAVVEIGALVQREEHWVKVVALYPRIELLKDQFNEAFRFVRHVDPVLIRQGRRPIRLATFFSLTPRDRSIPAVEAAGWVTQGKNFVCPFLSCPLCGDELLWSRRDIERDVERLVCRQAPRCKGVATGDQVILTRSELAQQPADIVFTTTEALNQRLSDTPRRHIFGIHPREERRVRFVLLDEIHTYDGTTGAQTALVLRRWRHALSTPARFVGLSATLREAPQFFADLVGFDVSSVVETGPTADEEERRSMVYQVVLRGNPASQTQLLSTSIQTAFLLSRLLDPGTGVQDQSAGSEGRFGSRLFVFTDDLDVTNRLFDNLRDAEAYDIFGRPDPQRQPLAALRSSTNPDPIPRDRAGQNWRFVEFIGHPTDRRLRISRTSSQDKGVNAVSDVIVATASLEVGFNDPTVGAILQHKSPHGMSAYIQRKGRAGRTQQMRPWIVTVLSDYGRDRLTYQAYDQLLDPVLTPHQFPVKNRYILRMQAVFAFMDWLSETLGDDGFRGWLWQVLNGPTESNTWVADQQHLVGRRLDALLKGEGPWLQQLSVHLHRALQLDTEEEVTSLLWEPPRALMLEVIPTLARRICTQWAAHPQNEGGLQSDIVAGGGRVHPLPDFIPATLFGELNIPDVTVIIPPATRRHAERRESLGIVQALCQLSPGRVTRRFAYERGGLYHWVPVPIDGGDFMLRVSDYAEQFELVTMVPILSQGETRSVPCFRPWTVRLTSVSERHVSPTSNAVLSWRSQLLVTADPVTVGTEHDPIWGDLLLQTDFYLHAFRTPVTVRRFALESMATVRRPRVAQEIRVRTRFTTEDGNPAAIGFEQEVDGICLRLRLPDRQVLAEWAMACSHTPIWRAAYFRDCVLDDPVLGQLTNWFQRDWLHQIYLSALLSQAVHADVSLAEGCALLHEQDPLPILQGVMDCIFRIALDESDEEEERDESVPSEVANRTLANRLIDLLHQPAVLDRLHTLAVQLWDPDPQRWSAWLAARVQETLAEAALQACYRIAPSYVAADSLFVDIGNGMPETHEMGNDAEIWVTEATLGGAGVIEAIAEHVVAHPRTLLTALEAALAPNELEVVAAGLNIFIRLAREDAEVRAIVAALRRQEGHREHEQQFRVLVTLLARKGLNVDHSLSIALHQRLLRRGTSEESDRLIADLLTYWQACQEQFNIGIDLRVFCYLAVVRPTFSQRLRALIAENTGSGLTIGERVAVLSGLLWPQPAEQRSRALQSYSPFRSRRWTDPSLVRELVLSKHVQTVHFGEADWREQLHAALANGGMAHLTCAREGEAELHRALYPLLLEPVNCDYLQFFPSIEQVQRDDASTTVTFTLRELV